MPDNQSQNVFTHDYKKTMNISIDSSEVFAVSFKHSRHRCIMTRIAIKVHTKIVIINK